MRFGFRTVITVERWLLRHLFLQVVIHSSGPTPAGATQTRAAYRAPRPADGKPNLNGDLASSERSGPLGPRTSCRVPGPLLTVGAHVLGAPGLGVVEGGEIPYKPEAAAKQKENFTNRLKLDPEIKCYMGGVPRSYLHAVSVPDRPGHRTRS